MPSRPFTLFAHSSLIKSLPFKNNLFSEECYSRTTRRLSQCEANVWRSHAIILKTYFNFLDASQFSAPAKLFKWGWNRIHMCCAERIANHNAAWRRRSGERGCSAIGYLHKNAPNLFLPHHLVSAYTWVPSQRLPGQAALSSRMQEFRACHPLRDRPLILWESMFRSIPLGLLFIVSRTRHWRVLSRRACWWAAQAEQRLRSLNTQLLVINVTFTYASGLQCSWSRAR